VKHVPNTITKFVSLSYRHYEPEGKRAQRLYERRAGGDSRRSGLDPVHQYRPEQGGIQLATEIVWRSQAGLEAHGFCVRDELGHCLS